MEARAEAATSEACADAHFAVAASSCERMEGMPVPAAFWAKREGTCFTPFDALFSVILKADIRVGLHPADPLLHELDPLTGKNASGI